MEQYLKKITDLAEEIQTIQNGFYIGKFEMLQTRINQLIGYILANKELKNG
jgi:hypothetical protein